MVPVLERRHCFRSLAEGNLIAGAIGRDGRGDEIAADLECVYALFPRLKERHRLIAGLTSGGEPQMTVIARAPM
ncbi:hypothetical protein [Bradyrhizobium sp. USDA 10063]